eukprot:scaffold1535_cov382-Prasinococcus_capsulatus_cf.AAC.51
MSVSASRSCIQKSTGYGREKNRLAFAVVSSAVAPIGCPMLCATLASTCGSKAGSLRCGLIRLGLILRGVRYGASVSIMRRSSGIVGSVLARASPFPAGMQSHRQKRQ